MSFHQRKRERKQDRGKQERKQAKQSKAKQAAQRACAALGPWQEVTPDSWSPRPSRHRRCSGASPALPEVPGPARGFEREPRGSEAAAAPWTSRFSRGTRLGLSGALGAPAEDFSAGPRLCPARLGERVRSCPASSSYMNLKTGRFKSGDATQYSVLFVCL